MKILKTKENFGDKHDHNLLRPLDILPNFPYTTGDRKHDYY